MTFEIPKKIYKAVAIAGLTLTLGLTGVAASQQIAPRNFFTLHYNRIETSGNFRRAVASTTWDRDYTLTTWMMSIRTPGLQVGNTGRASGFGRLSAQTPWQVNPGNVSAHVGTVSN
ncbi:MAG: hypothetical protein FWF59_14305 [Turicibacter sp.]|nr:hypothetical protein [Turicibacter sp.]